MASQLPSGGSEALLQRLGTYQHLPRIYYANGEALLYPNPKPTNSVIWPPNVGSSLRPMPVVFTVS
jgi:hypothetical protein